MKYKKYIFVLLLFLFIGCNKTYAIDNVDCYYLGNGFSTKYKISNHTAYVGAAAMKSHNDNSEGIKNWKKNEKIGDYTIPAYNNTGECPTYLVLNYDTVFIHNFRVYATNSEQEAKNAASAYAKIKTGYYGYYAVLQPNMTKDEYDEKRFDYIIEKIKENGYGGSSVSFEGDQACTVIFGDADDDGIVDKDGNYVKPPSLAYMINSALQYVRIIVPILIILLGTIDFARAVIASKEDEMKKAQTKFVKRLIVGLAVFFVPTFVDMIMWLADIVWEGLGYSTCSL